MYRGEKNRSPISQLPFRRSGEKNRSPYLATLFPAFKRKELKRRKEVVPLSTMSVIEAAPMGEKNVWP